MSGSKASIFWTNYMANAVETLEKLERRLTVSIPVADITTEVEKRLKVRARTAKAPGFRPGKVPMDMVAQQYGAGIQNEVLNEKISAAFAKAVEENNLRVAGYPRFEEKTGDDVSKDEIAFTATFEVYPEVKIGDLSKVELEKAVATVTDEEVNKTLDILRKRQAHFHVKGEDGEHGKGGDDVTAQDGDRVTINFTGRIDGVEFEGGKSEDFPFVLGEKQMLPEFEDAIRGMKSGETKVFPLTFPENYHGKDVAGKTAEFTVTVTKIEWAHLPELNEEFAKKLGIADGSVEKLKSDIRTNLEREVKNRLISINKNRVMDALVNVSEFDIPQALVKQEIDQLIDMTRRDLAVRNPAQKDIALPPELFTAQAEKRVRLGMLLGELIKDNILAVSADKLKERATEIAASYENPQMVIDYYLKDPTRRRELEAMIMEENAMDYVFGKAKVTDKAVPFEELMAQQL